MEMKSIQDIARDATVELLRAMEGIAMFCYAKDGDTEAFRQVNISFPLEFYAEAGHDKFIRAAVIQPMRTLAHEFQEMNKRLIKTYPAELPAGRTCYRIATDGLNIMFLLSDDEKSLTALVVV